MTATSPLEVKDKAHSPWLGVVLSIFVSGAGQFYSGRRSSGIRWFIVLNLAYFLCLWLSASSWIPTPISIVAGLLVFVAWLLMLRNSYAAVDHRGILEWLTTLIVLALLAMLPTVEIRLMLPLFQAFKVPTASMEPTIRGASGADSNGSGDHVFLDKCAYRFRKPQVGDIVGIEMTGFSDAFPHSTLYLRRVVGVPGDKIEVNGRTLHRNGQPVEENYTQFVDPNSVYEHYGPFMLLPNHYFLMADNRDNSQDSRWWGPIPEARIVGKLSRIYWPLNRAGSVH